MHFSIQNLLISSRPQKISCGAHSCSHTCTSPLILVVLLHGVHIMPGGGGCDHYMDSRHLGRFSPAPNVEHREVACNEQVKLGENE